MDGLSKKSRQDHEVKVEVSFDSKILVKALVIESVRPGARTVADDPKEPIAPGGEGEITVLLTARARKFAERKLLSQPIQKVQFIYLVFE